MRSLIWRGANQRGLWIQLTHEFSEVKGQLAHHQEQTKKTTGLSGALKGPKKRGRAKKKIRTKNPQTFWLKTAIQTIMAATKLNGATDLEKLRDLCSKTHKEQAVWFLNAFWEDFMEGFIFLIYFF